MTCRRKGTQAGSSSRAWLPAHIPLALPAGLRFRILRARYHLGLSPSFHPPQGPFLALVKSPDFVARSGIQMLALLLSGYESLGRLYNLFVPQFSRL